ncbi:MAG: Unknown protein [uncultured Sulfurovum sp.]|uniref:Uncharacterized protein n=1 Tax=uncultured Sulfurovum sp. TaxID=269237 RepID=A0A6S6U718_9BACT|nr:MAG: Unknown protein [uncultured Sulfurovum sp.]
MDERKDIIKEKNKGTTEPINLSPSKVQFKQNKQS